MRNLVKWHILSFVLCFFISCTINDDFTTNPPINTPFPPPFIEPDIPTTKRPGSFPFELIPDTLTVATCNNSFDVAGNNFVLSLGAYRDHGLRLSQTFVQENNINDNTHSQIIRHLLEQSTFKTARARFALQNASNLNLIYKNNRGNVEQFFPPFNNPPTLENLSEKRAVFTTRSSNYESVNLGGRFEARLPITGVDLKTYARGLATESSGEYLLTLTYTNQVANQGTKLILSGQGTPYGRGYKISFANYHTDYLREVREENLVTTQQEGTWSCPSSLVFPILRSISEKNNPFNYKKANDSTLSNEKKEAYCDTQNSRSSKMERDFFLRVFGTDHIQKLPFHFGKIVFPDESESDSSQSCCRS